MLTQCYVGPLLVVVLALAACQPAPPRGRPPPARGV